VRRNKPWAPSFEDEIPLGELVIKFPRFRVKGGPSSFREDALEVEGLHATSDASVTRRARHHQGLGFSASNWRSEARWA